MPRTIKTLPIETPRNTSLAYELVIVLLNGGTGCFGWFFIAFSLFNGFVVWSKGGVKDNAVVAIIIFAVFILAGASIALTAMSKGIKDFRLIKNGALATAVFKEVTTRTQSRDHGPDTVFWISKYEFTVGKKKYFSKTESTDQYEYEGITEMQVLYDPLDPEKNVLACDTDKNMTIDEQGMIRLQTVRYAFWLILPFLVLAGEIYLILRVFLYKDVINDNNQEIISGSFPLPPRKMGIFKKFSFIFQETRIKKTLFGIFVGSGILWMIVLFREHTFAVVFVSLFAAVFVYISVVYFISGATVGLRRIWFYKNGELVKAVLVEKKELGEAFSDMTGKKAAYKVKYEYEVSGQKYQAEMKTFELEYVEDDETERVFYDRENPAVSILVDDLPKGIKIDSTGNIKIKNYFTGFFVFLVACSSVVFLVYTIKKVFFDAVSGG